MKTQDITNSGIDRNFLRECERQGLISPKRNDNEWIVNKTISQESTRKKKWR